MKGKTLRIKIKKKIQMGILLGAVLLTLGGCSFLNPGETSKQEEPALSGVVTLTPGMYDSEDTAIVIKKNTEDSTIQFQNLTTGKKYTLNYDGATHIYDKYDQAISLEQVECGSIVTVRFYKPKKLLASLKLDKQAMHFEELENFVLDTKRGTIAVGETVYNLSSHLVIISQEEQVEVMDINQMDVLSVWGYNNQVYSINVEQGHGYLRLQNDTYFVDGWIEIGQKMIRKITEDMLIVVPEGKMAVKVSHNGSSATQEITFARNEEMVWDLGDVEITEIQKGKIIFTLDPSEAKVTIDGKNVDTSSPVELEYGVHQMTVTADGYDALAQYIKVREASANINIELDKKEGTSDGETNKEDTDEEKSESAKTKDTSDSKTEDEKTKTSTETSDKVQTTASSSDGKNKVNIDSPEGAEVYLDGNYIGIAPVSFAKEVGNYVITLRKTGYQTRSYTVQIDDEDRDVNYSFADLMKVE